MKIDRLIGILSILLQKDKVTAPYLADKFEVSRRTINRDIEEICMAGIPLVTIRGKNGGITIMDGFRVDKTLLTSSEMQAILTGLQGLDSVSKTRRYQQLMEKLSRSDVETFSEKQHIMVDLSCWNKSALAPKLEFLQKAIADRKMIQFRYYSVSGSCVRKVEPYVLIFQWSSWYLWGYCLKRRDYRMFKLNRMVELLDTQTEYQCRMDSRPQHLKKYEPCQMLHATARFQSSMKWRLMDEYGVEELREQEDHTILVSCDFPDESSLISWILSYRDQAELLSPASVRDNIKNILSHMIQSYSQT